MSWNPFKKEAKEQQPPAGDAADAVPPDSQDATDPLIELGDGPLTETAALVREAGGVRLERVTLAGGSAPFLRLRVLKPGELAQSISRLLLELPEAATGFCDMLVDSESTLAAKLMDAPLTLAEAPRLQQVIEAIADTAALLAEAQRMTGLAWANPLAEAVLLHPAEDDAQGLRTLSAQFAGWDGLAKARGDETAKLAMLGAEVCRARVNATTGSPDFSPGMAGAEARPTGGTESAAPQSDFHTTQAESLARWFEALAESPNLTYTGVAEACANVQPKLARASATDPGMKRAHNEDACLVLDLEQASSGGARFTLAAVADGMGGHASGEVASHLALSLLRQHVLSNLLAPRQAGPDPAALAGYLASVIPAIDTALIERANLDEALAGMGTTLCGYAQLAAQSTLPREGGPSLAADPSRGGAVSPPGGGTASAAPHSTGALFNVGDSRAYLLTARGALRLSHDHSLVQGLVDSGAITEAEAFAHPQKNVITRCLGGSSSAGSEPDVLEMRAGPGDCILLCSDGLSDMLDDAAISAAVSETGLDNLNALAAELIRRANAAGGKDNITVVLLRWELHC